MNDATSASVANERIDIGRGNAFLSADAPRMMVSAGMLAVESSALAAGLFGRRNCAVAGSRRLRERRAGNEQPDERARKVRKVHTLDYDGQHDPPRYLGAATSHIDGIRDP